MNLLMVLAINILTSIQSSILFIQDTLSGEAMESVDPEQMKLYVVLLIVFAFLAIFGLTFVVRAYQELRKQYKVIEDQHNEIADKNNELAFKNESLEELNMEKNNMISVVAHDMKAPLGNIQGLVELIRLEDKNLSDDQNNYLELLKKVSKETGEMVDIMLNVHRIESELHELTLHEYDIVELISKVIKLHEPALKLKGGHIDYNSACESCTLNTDKQYFQQIVSNILQNAVDYSPENGRIELSLKEDDNYVSISIKDSGTGISDDDQKRLFGGYKKLDGAEGDGKSAGIGLAIVKRLLEKLHGKIEIISKVGKGSTFRVDLLKNL